MSSRPFEGHCFCFTGIKSESQRRNLKKIIESMGGLYQDKLRRDSRFLVVGERWTDKYNFAVQYRPAMVFLSPDALEKIHEKWLTGGTVCGVQDLDAHRIKTFTRLTVCTANLNSKDQQAIALLVKSDGGIFSRSLTAACNILVTPYEVGPKVEGAKRWGIPIVDPRWIVASMNRGQAVQPQLFDLSLPQSEMGLANAFAPFSHATHETTANNGHDSNAECGSAMRKSSLHAPLKKSENVWNALMRTSTGAKQTSPVFKSFSPTISEPTATSGMFAGITFNYCGFDARQEKILAKTIESFDGSIQENPNYLIINSADPTIATSKPLNSHVITEWAIERSMHYRRCCLDDMWGQPVSVRNIKEFQNLQICISGYSGCELTHLIKLIGLLGASHCETLTPERSLLIAKGRKRRVKYAEYWGLPIVTESWLWKCAQEGLYLDPKIDTKRLEFSHDMNAITAGTGIVAHGDESSGFESRKDCQTSFTDSASDDIVYVDEDQIKKAALLVALGEEAPKQPPHHSTLPASNTKRLKSMNGAKKNQLY